MTVKISENRRIRLASKYHIFEPGDHVKILMEIDGWEFEIIGTIRSGRWFNLPEAVTDQIDSEYADIIDIKQFKKPSGLSDFL